MLSGLKYKFKFQSKICKIFCAFRFKNQFQSHGFLVRFKCVCLTSLSVTYGMLIMFFKENEKVTASL